MNSRNKGATGEREFAKSFLIVCGVSLERNLEQTRSGGHDLVVPDSEDSIYAHLIRELAIEVKRRKKITDSMLNGFWTQACVQAEEAGLVPCLAYRADNASWRLSLPLDWLYGTKPMDLGYESTFHMGLAGMRHLLVGPEGLNGD